MKQKKTKIKSWLEEVKRLKSLKEPGLKMSLRKENKMF